MQNGNGVRVVPSPFVYTFVYKHQDMFLSCFTSFTWCSERIFSRPWSMAPGVYNRVLL